MDIEDIQRALANLDSAINWLEGAWFQADSDTDRVILMEQMREIKQVMENLESYFLPKTNTSAS